MTENIGDQDVQEFLSDAFVSLLRDHDGGRLATMLERKINDLGDAVRKNGKQGRLSLTITVAPEGADEYSLTPAFRRHWTGSE